MKIEQFEDKSLAHYSYAILSNCEKKIILIDPARNPQPYYDFAKTNDAEIVGVIETHPHADFVSSHLEISTATGAKVYISERANVFYSYQAFDEGQFIEIGHIKLSAINTPGHSPDSISILLEHKGVPKALFTGDTLFIGDCGRPDLREGVGGIQLNRNDLAKMMYHSLQEKLAILNEDVIVYPAHGAGTLCGKNLSDAAQSTIGMEKQTNWSMQPQSEDEFVKQLLSDQPFIPAYFPFDVELNRKGAAPFRESINEVDFSESTPQLTDGIFIIDIRDEKSYKESSLPHSINLMSGNKFETWLGTIIKPGEPFYLAGDNKENIYAMIERVAAIGYEKQLQQAFINTGGSITMKHLDIETFRNEKQRFTIIDVRNENEVKSHKIFENSLAIPLGQLRQCINQIPTDKPIVVHCAGGYRSAAGSSLIQALLPGNLEVYELGQAIKTF